MSENHEAVLATYTGRDPEDAIAEITRWSVTGRDGGDFTINEDGELTFRNPPDYERPADSDRDNEYEVTVRASDGQVYGTYDVTVTVEAVDEVPELRRGSRDSFSYRENGASDLYTYRATDRREPRSPGLSAAPTAKTSRSAQAASCPSRHCRTMTIRRTMTRTTSTK